jgi:hypothetical protein
MYVFIAAWTLFSFIIIGSILFILSLMVILILRRRELLGVVPVSEQQRLHLIFLAYSLFFMFVVFWTPVILGDYPSNAKIRYIIFVFYYAMLALLPTLIIILRTSKQVNILQSIASILLVLSLTILAITHVSRKEFTYGLKSYFNYYPDIARCLDELKKKYPLKHGVSEYWRAKVVTLFSRENVRLYSVYDVNMVPYKHLENENWYYETGYGRYDPPVFNFVIFPKGDSLDPVYRQLGEPLAREECGDYNFLLVNDYIYKRGEKFPVLKNSVVIKPE